MLKKQLLERVPVSDLCDQYGVHPAVFHRWMKEFFGNAALAYVKQRLDGGKDAIAAANLSRKWIGGR